MKKTVRPDERQCGVTNSEALLGPQGAIRKEQPTGQLIHCGWCMCVVFCLVNFSVLCR